MLRLNVGTHRKVRQPNYGSAHASRNPEIEIGCGLFQARERLQAVLRLDFSGYINAVNDEQAHRSSPRP